MSVPRGHLPVVECSICQVAAVIRLGMSLTSGNDAYCYQPDCKHRARDLVIRYGSTAAGPFIPEAG